MNNKLKVVIYTDRIFALSENFILSQGENLRRFEAFYVGSRLVEKFPIPLRKSIIINRGGIIGKQKELIYKLFGIAPQFFRRIQQIEPVMIHAHFGPDGAMALPIARRLKVPLIVTFHGFDATIKDEYARHSFYRHRIYIRRRKSLQREASLFVAVSNFIHKKLLEQNFPSEKIVTHYIGINSKIFRVDQNKKRKPIVLFVGRLVENKGCQYLLFAMREIQKTFPNLELLVIGDGPLRSNLERMASKMLKKYRFLGSQPLENVKAWMNRAKIFCVPSITIKSGASEGLGIVFLEAQAMGLPVVSFSTGGIPEAVANGETGFLVPEHDWESLAKHILLLWKDNALWHRFSIAGQNRIKTYFDIQKQSEKLEDLYNLILKQWNECM